MSDIARLKTRPELRASLLQEREDLRQRLHDTLGRIATLHMHLNNADDEAEYYVARMQAIDEFLK